MKNIIRFIVLIIVAFLLFLLLSKLSFKEDDQSFQPTHYDPLYAHNHNKILGSSGHEINDYIRLMFREINRSNSLFAVGDIYLILARLTNNSLYYKQSCEAFLKYKPGSNEEEPILYETLASINCQSKRDAWLRLAINSWNKAGKSWRAEILSKIIDNNNELDLIFDREGIKPSLDLSNAERIIIGRSNITINPEDTIVTQEDRVLRDWLSAQLAQDPFDGEHGEPLTVFLEQYDYDKHELRPEIGWHEGGRLKDIKNHLNINHFPAVGTLVGYDEATQSWYAPDENGIFRFSIPEDKLYYPTVRFLSENVALTIDTHGINMIVDQAITYDADAVIGCCDYPGKAKAAVYLSEHNISVLCFTDRFIDLALGHNSNILGSPYYEIAGDKIVFGNRKIEIKRNDKIVVTNTNIGYPIQYYDTALRYFSEINKTFPLQIIDVLLSEYNETDKVFSLAEEVNAKIVGYRIYNYYDYSHAKQWLEKSQDNKIILFHSTAYPYGVLLAKEYPDQVGFDDPNPTVETN